MNHGELKTYVRTLINRSDLTDPLVVQFIQQAQDRLERVLRPAFLQHFLTFSLDGTGGDFRVPSDFLKLIDLYTDDGKIKRKDVAQWLKFPNLQGVPEAFIQTGHDIRMRPFPPAATVIYLHYYGVEPELVADSDSNYWTSATVDAFAYAAVALAADFFEDERLAGFEAKFQLSKSEIESQQEDEDTTGSTEISPAYSYPEDY